jgi:hypothetical protein
MRIGAGQEYQVGTIDSEAELPQLLRAVADQLAPRQGVNAEMQRRLFAGIPEALEELVQTAAAQRLLSLLQGGPRV